MLRVLGLPPAAHQQISALDCYRAIELANVFAGSPFHDTANLGADRAKVNQGELLKLPFDAPARAAVAEEKIVPLIDREVEQASELLSVQSDLQ